MNVCEINTAEIDRVFEKLQNDEIRNQILINSLKKGGEVLQQETIKSLKKEVTTANDSMIKGVRLGTDKAYLTVYVSILKYFVLRWFEKGTEPRYRKIRGTNAEGKRNIKKDSNGKAEKGGYTGEMTATNFFSKARESSKEAVEKAIVNEFEKQMRNYVK